MNKEKRTVVVIGGGITGLASAYYLQREIEQNNLPLKVKLIEATHRLGGKIKTLHKDGFVIERGPDSLFDGANNIKDLAKQIGLGGQIVRNVVDRSFVLARGKLHSLPVKANVGLPLQITPFITTRLFSLPGKFRAAGDLIISRSNPVKDQSLGQFFRRRFGDEVVENLIEPLLSGVYAGDIDQLSLMATLPSFYHLEQEHRSLVWGIKKKIPEITKSNEHGTHLGLLFNFKTGLGSFVNALEKHLPRDTILKSTKVEYITKAVDKYIVDLNSGKQIIADGIIVATPYYVTSKIFADYPFFAPLNDIPATSVASVTLAFPEEAIKKDIKGSEFAVSRNTDFSITACYLLHKKWPYTVPAGKALIRCYVGRSGHETIVDLSDDQITKIVLEDLNRTMEIVGEPEFSVVSRWKDSMPQYIVGHQIMIDSIKSAMATELPGVFLAGSSYDGQSIPECVAQGESSVQNILKYFQHET